MKFNICIGSAYFVTLLLLMSSHAVPCRAEETAEEYRSRALILEKQGEFAKASEMHTKAAAEDSRQIKASKSFLGIQILTGNYQIVAVDFSHAGMDYYKTGQYEKGINVYKKGLAVLREGNLEKDIPLCLNSIAWGYFQQHENDDGLKYLAEAAEAAEKSGMDRLASDYLNDEGNLLSSFGRYAESITIYEKKQKLCVKLKDEHCVATTLNNIGQANRGLGQFDNAIDYFKQAYVLHKTNGMDAEAAVNMNNIGLVYESRGHYDKALRAYDNALNVYRAYHLEERISNVLNNIGSVYFAWGLYDKSLTYYEDALQMSRKSGDEAGIALNLGSIGAVYRAIGRYDEALKYYEESLAIDRKVGRNDNAADMLNCIGTIYIMREQLEKASKYLEEALSIVRKTGNKRLTTNILYSIAAVYFKDKKYQPALEKYEEALSLSRATGDEDSLSNILYNIGRVRFETGMLAEAEQSFRESVLIKEKLRKTAPGSARRDYTANQILMYQYLTSAEIRQKNISEAVKSIELGKAKFLAEQLAGGDSETIAQSGNDVRRQLPADTAVIMYANTNQRDKVIVAITKSDLLGIEVANIDLYDAKWSRYSDEATAGLAGARNVHLVERDRKGTRLIELKPSCSCDAVINYYRTLLIASGQNVRGAAIKQRQARTDDEEIRALGKLLYQIFVKPVESVFKGKKKLLISTDGALGVLPFETLIDDSGKYLVETYEIGYVHSMTIRDLIRKRNYEEKRKPLLAFGGALYNTAGDKPRQTATGETIKKRDESFRGRYSEVGLGKWTNLPYTLMEVEAIGRVVPGSKVYSGKEVSEEMVKELDRKGDLAKYTVIHFATHGMVVPAFPELSALVLSQGADDSGEDGYLRMDEIAKLKLRADFVNLSACDTGLGKLYEGEGVVSLAHAFLIAGANSLSVSLWQVADESTAKFMTGLYKLAGANGGDYALAITEMKRKFMRGEYGAKFKAPYYWAPFVYYGQ